MSRRSKTEYLQVMQERYRGASKKKKQALLNEVCKVCHYHRKHAIRVLNGPWLDDKPKPKPRTPRRETYGPQLITILLAVWEAAGYPWSARLKALIPLWLPWIRKHFRLTPALEPQLLKISPRQMDRRLQPHKRKLKRRIYGRTKPGRWLKHQIAIRTEHWDVNRPGWLEVDLVSHSGDSADGEFIYSLNLTDILTGWVETRAVLGKGQQGIIAALEEMIATLPFAVLGIDSDNGSEFINHHLYRFCRKRHIEFTRGRPYKKDDNAHIEQKNWTHVRKLMGWERYRSRRALTAMNEFYRSEWRVMMNLFQPCVKLQAKVRVGAKLQRRYGKPMTPLARVIKSCTGTPAKVKELEQLQRECDPFDLAQAITRKLESVWQLAEPRGHVSKSKKRG